MSRRRPEDLGIIDRLTAAAAIGQGLDPADTQEIARALRSALGGARTWLELDHEVRAEWRAREMRAVAQRLWLASESRRGFARRLHRRLVNYRAGQFIADATGPAPRGERWFLFRMLQATMGRVPSLTTLRGLLPAAAAGQHHPLFSGHGAASQSRDDANQADDRR